MVPIIRSILTILAFTLLTVGIASAAPVSAGTDTLDWNKTSDGGLTTANIDDNPLPEVFFAWTSGANGGGEDALRYKVAFNVTDFTAIDWSAAVYNQYNSMGLLGDATDGTGIAIGDVNRNGVPDILFLAVDDPDGENQLYLNFGWDLDPATGRPTGGWTHRVIKYNSSSFHIGTSTSGAGAALAYVDDNDVLDIVFAFADDPSGRDSLYYYVIFNLSETGRYSSLSDRYVIDIDTEMSFTGGLGIEVGDYNDNLRPDMVVAVTDIDETHNHETDVIHQNRTRYSLSWDMNTDGSMPKWGGTTEFDPGTVDSVSGTGVAMMREDEHFAHEMLFVFVEENVTWNIAGDMVVADQDDVAYFSMYDNRHADWQQGTFRNSPTNQPVHLVRHLGRLVAVTATENGTGLKYNVIDDGENWSSSTMQEFAFPATDNDTSVISTHVSDDFTYDYSTTGLPVASFRAVSDDTHFYTIRRVIGKGLLIDRFVLDEQNFTFSPSADVRYRRSEMKCETSYSDTFDFRNTLKETFIEPTTVFSGLVDPAETAGGLSRNSGFDVRIMPSSLPDEARWFFAQTFQDGSIHTVSTRRALTDECVDTDGDDEDDFVTMSGLLDTRSRSLTYYDDTDTLKTATVVGTDAETIDVDTVGISGIGGCGFSAAPSFLPYANQQTCDASRVRTEQRIMMAARTDCAGGEIMVLDFPVTTDGIFPHASTDFDNATATYPEPECGEAHDAIVKRRLPDGALDSVSDTAPVLFESVDGYLRLSFHNTSNYSYVRIYDPFTNEWVQNGDAAASGVIDNGEWISGKPYLRTPLGGRPFLVNYPLTFGEYGAYERNDDGSLQGIMRRGTTLVDGTAIYYAPGATVGALETEYKGQVLIDLTLLGYIEGAPPVPREILTVDDADYHAATGVGFNQATSVSQNYTQGKDWGFDFSSEGFIHHFAWMLEISYSFLQERSTSNSNTNVFDITKNLDGAWDATNFRWEPENRGSAFVRAKKADLFALYIGESESVLGYRTIPLAESEEEYIIPFRINPAYVKNGTLDGYVDDDHDPDWIHLDDAAGEKGSYYRMDELNQLDEDIKATAARIDAVYLKKDTDAFENLPSEDKLSQRSFCNEYQWAPDGSASKTWSFANMFSESQGGSFELLGMAGGHFELGALGQEFAEFQVLAGAHINVNFEKSQESEEAFELNVENSLNSGNTKGSVDSYKWRTCYLEASSDRFEDFYDRVVDADWLESTDHYAEQLREARGRKNAAWRIRHFVTYVSRQYDAVTETEGGTSGGSGDSNTYTCTRNEDGSYTCVPQ